MAIGGTNSISTPGSGVPAGGVQNQVLTKLSEKNYDMAWLPQNPFPALGVNGDVLLKTDNGVAWVSILNSGALTEEIDPTVPEWAKQPNPPGPELTGSAAAVHTHTADQIYGGQLAGPVSAFSDTNYQGRQIRNIICGTTPPEDYSIGEIGDIYFVYEP